MEIPQLDNEFCDILMKQELANESLKKLVLSEISQNCFPLEDKVVSRLA